MDLPGLYDEKRAKAASVAIDLCHAFYWNVRENRSYQLSLYLIGKGMTFIMGVSCKNQSVPEALEVAAAGPLDVYRKVAIEHNAKPVLQYHGGNARRRRPDKRRCVADGGARNSCSARRSRSHMLITDANPRFASLILRV